MRKTQHILLFATLLIGTPLLHAQDSGGLKSLRGHKDLSQSSNPAEQKRWQRDREPVDREFVHQPPIIPHKITGYQINLKSNKCLTCHSWANYKESNATKISMTHFSDRDGNDLSNVSARRYFCTQCHVPQVDSKPLVENTFKPVRSIKAR